MALVELWHWLGLALVGFGIGWVWRWLGLALVGFGIGWVWHWLGLASVGFGFGWVWHWLGLASVGFGVGWVWHQLGLALVWHYAKNRLLQAKSVTWHTDTHTHTHPDNTFISIDYMIVTIFLVFCRIIHIF